MTLMMDISRDFIQALTPDARRRLLTRDGMLDWHTYLKPRDDGTPGPLQAALGAGWTAAEIAAECSRNLNVTNPIAVAVHRMRKIADGTRPKPVPTGPARFVQPQPWCGDDLCQEQGRWRLDPTTFAPIGHCRCWTVPVVALSELNRTQK